MTELRLPAEERNSAVEAECVRETQDRSSECAVYSLARRSVHLIKWVLVCGSRRLDSSDRRTKEVTMESRYEFKTRRQREEW